MLMSRTVAQPVAHNERAGMFMKVVLKAVPGVRCVVLCCVGDVLENLFGAVRYTNFWCTLCCVLVCCAVLCCVGDVSGDLV